VNARVVLIPQDLAFSYLEPEVVCTTTPSAGSLVIGDVVMDSPSPKVLEPKITPEMEPSRFCLQLEIAGTPLGAEATFFAGTLGFSFGDSSID
jgi:hypothetical protein